MQQRENKILKVQILQLQEINPLLKKRNHSTGIKDYCGMRVR